MANKKVIKRVLEYAIVAAIIALIALIYFKVAKEASEIFTLNKNKDYAALKEYLKSFGTKGMLIISLLEMLQMIVVFIPAEFVQVSAGLAYPIYIAVPICMFGVFLGSSVIFVLVRFLHIRLEVLERNSGKIQRFISKINKDTSMTVIMYILFIMPLIPFGAIAYFASSSKIKYPRYALVCTTGVIPSILSSFILGNVMYNFLGKGSVQFISAVVLVIVLMCILLLTLSYVVKRIFFVKKYQKSNFVIYHIFYFFVSLFMSFKTKINKKYTVRPDKKPFVVIGRHTTFFDFYYLAKAIYPHRPTIVCNSFYFEYKPTRSIVPMLGAIPKRLFTADIETVKQIYAAKEQNCAIVIFPEGRLSNDGTSTGAVENTERLLKKLGIDVYTFHTVGGYFSKPKWRNFIVKHKVDLYLEKLFSAEQLQQLSATEIHSKLNDFFTYDETVDYAKMLQKQGATNVEGLENVIYMCPECGAEYSLSSKGNVLTCKNCNKEFAFDENYISPYGSIHDLYLRQKLKEESAETFSLTEKCEIARINKDKGVMVRCGSGVCRLTDSGITYTGTDDIATQASTKNTPQADANTKSPQTGTDGSKIIGDIKTADSGIVADGKNTVEYADNNNIDNNNIDGNNIDNNNTVEYTATPQTMSALAYSCAEEFEFYVNKDLIYFYPENAKSVVKWALIWDILVERANKKGK